MVTHGHAVHERTVAQKAPTKSQNSGPVSHAAVASKVEQCLTIILCFLPINALPNPN